MRALPAPALAVAAMSFGVGSAQFAGASTATPPAEASPVPDPEAALLFRVEQTGGFVPAEYVFTNIPVVSIYADGRVITTGPMIEIYPQPALPNLRQMVLTDAGLRRVVDTIRDTGLFMESVHYDGPPVTDVPDTVFTLNDGGRTVVVSAYALGFDESMLPEQVDGKARTALLDLLTFVTDLPNSVSPSEVASADEAYRIDRIKVLAREFDPENPPWEDPALAQPTAAWPLDQPLASIAEPYDGPFGDLAALCASLDGDDAKSLVSALRGANQLTPWESEGTHYLLWARPILPDEPGSC